ncbi:MAG: sialate O-acetylesterase [Pirellulales bacterium]|nr:sialate O-acetylesterase [Pirellulales bacterium]
MRLIAAYLAAVLALLGPAVLRADVQLHPLFTDGAVLQQGMPLKVWGQADDGEEVAVSIAGQEAKATARGGQFQVVLPPLKAGGPYEMVVQGKNTITVRNVLVGEVWIASGQSNMQWSVAQSEEPEKVAAASANSRIRLFTVSRRATAEPQESVPVRPDQQEGMWLECGPDTVMKFSAVAYHFGKSLCAALDVPIGLISTNYGGTPAEAWTSRQTLEGHPGLKADFGGIPATEKPNSPGGLYNAMVHPLLGYGIRGAIWYQGESNAGRAYQYRTLFPAMIEDWRNHWGQGDFPFLLVQLAPFTAIKPDPGESDWAELREAQLLATKLLKNVGMAVITDLGDEKDIHPKPKGPVGERLALCARAIAYGEDIVYSGPLYRSMERRGNRIVLSFDHVDGGLEARGGELKGFTICGEDRKFVNAYAEIKGDTIEVYSPEVPEPVAVRFGWANYPVVNLYNKAGLPASPFRTDDFPGITQPK